MPTNNNKVYLDANFLIYWALPKDNATRIKIRILLAKLLISKRELCVSTLSIDEAWFGIKNTYNEINNTTQSCFEESVVNELKKFTNILLQKATFLQFIDPKFGTNQALNFVENFKLKPRDSFHLSLMKEHLITDIATNDNDFNRIKSLADINVIN